MSWEVHIEQKGPLQLGHAGSYRWPEMVRVAENVWVIRYPLFLLGTQIGRTVTAIRLASGDLVIHSTGPFTSADVTAIRALGRPAMLLDATLFHDTFAREGRSAFPEVPYAAPEGFVGATTAVSVLSQTWPEEFAVLELAGMPKVREHAILHRPSRALIVADVVFNFGPSATAWTRAFFRWAGGISEFPGVSRLFRSCIRDRAAFIRAADQMLSWDFERVIVGHGDIIERDGKVRLKRPLARHGLCSGA